MKLGDECYDKTHYQEAIQYYTTALKNYAQYPKKPSLLLAQIYNNMGMSYLALKIYQQTDFCYKEALSLRQQALAIATSRHNEAHCKSIRISVRKVSPPSLHWASICVAMLVLHHLRVPFAIKSFQ